MTQVTTTTSEVDGDVVKTGLSVPVEVWHRAKVQAARKKQNLNEFSASAVEFYVEHLEEEQRREILADAKKKGY